jgi:hypothetical protein
MGQKIGLLTALQIRRTEAAEMMLLRPLAGYALYDHKINDSVRRKLQTKCILDKIDEYRQNWVLQLQRMPENRIHLKSYHKGGEQLEDQRNVGKNSCNSGDGTDQRVQSLMFMMMMMMTIYRKNFIYSRN